MDSFKFAALDQHLPHCKIAVAVETTIEARRQLLHH
jgi:hypothetical protein